MLTLRTVPLDPPGARERHGRRTAQPRSRAPTAGPPSSRGPRCRGPRRWPRAADAGGAARLAEQLAGRRGRASDARSTAALIACLGGNSPYLAGLAVREPESFETLLRRGPQAVVEAALSSLRALDPGASRAAVASAMRQAKRRVALASAVADIGGLWDLEQVSGTLSRLAEAALAAAVRHLLRAASSRGELVLPDPAQPERGSGFVVLGMGKLGAGELNYSSDVDLILLYDPDAHPGRDELRRLFVRLGGDLVTLMQARDADGYVFRTDLRLRPDPSSTPLVVSMPAAIAYYESLGQTWERAAMIKARPVAGDLARGLGFLDTIRPFVWRRHLDFTVVDDIQAMKRRIDRRRGTLAAAAPGDAGAVQRLLGHDLKLGGGGIREIEFLTQTMQLVWGGRAPALRDPTTLGALARLAEGSYMPTGLAAELATSYRLLRRVEHRLQMQDDRQTHSLPATREGFEAFACFMGSTGGPAGGEAFADTLLGPLARTRRAFEELFAGGAGRPAEAAASTLDLDAADLSARLERLGFPPGRAAPILLAWRTRQLRALRSDRAQALLREILPDLLAALGEQHDPMLALLRFDALLARQNAGVQLLSLFARNPPLIGRIAGVLGAAPSLADHLAAVPAALEGLLVPEQGAGAAPLLRRLLDAQLRSAGDVEEATRRARALVRGEEFRLSLAQLDGRLDVDRAGVARTALAERVIAGMLEQVGREHRGRFGRVAGGGMVVVALGKAGSREMVAGSDLDLMLIYDHPDRIAESVLPRQSGSGQRQSGQVPRPTRRHTLPASQYYTRFAHSLIAALSAPGAEGPLYALDMRLRPSGSKGPVAVSLAAFRRYHAERSWTWERMALSRARVVAGPPALRRRVAEAIREALDRPGISRRILLRDACAMRARVGVELPPRGPWDVKLRQGGLMEVEFIAQTLQLAGGDPRLRHPTTRIGLRRLADAGALARADAARLIEADRWWRAVQGMLRILFGTALPRSLDDASPAAVDALLRGVAASCPDPMLAAAAGQPGLGGLLARMQRTAEAVRAAFIRLIGDPADANLE